jgi:hypothetical protein
MPLNQQIFYMTQAQRKAEIEPHRMRYDLSGKTMTLVAMRRNIGRQVRAHAGKYRRMLRRRYRLMCDLIAGKQGLVMY